MNNKTDEKQIRNLIKKIIKEEIGDERSVSIGQGTPHKETYYVKWSSWFDTHPYNTKLITQIVESAGGQNVHLENRYGWPNQPQVVVFDVLNGDTESIKKAVQRGLKTDWIILLSKDWK